MRWSFRPHARHDFEYHYLIPILMKWHMASQYLDHYHRQGVDITGFRWSVNVLIWVFWVQ